MKTQSFIWRKINRVGLLIIAVLVIGCEYIPFSSGKLEGRIINPPSDWNLVLNEEIIQVETNPEEPYSVNLWIVNIDNTPHIFSGDNLSQWAKNILKNDKVRLKIGENIYPLRATRVVETERFEQFARGWDEKYGHRPLNENPTETYLFQLN